MRRSRLILICLMALVEPLTGQAQTGLGTIEGRVTLPTDDPAHRATVLLVPLGLVVETNEEGLYRFEEIPPGTYDVMSYQSPLDSETHLIQVAAGATIRADIQLRISPIRQEITVTARGREESTFEAIPSVTTLDSFALSEIMATSLGEVLDGQLGVSKRSFGAGNARPVVRGFDGDRVLIMQDGMRVGALASQSGDHGEPIDASNVERIEVVKGPATLLYGSNAVGGVVNAVSSHQEFHQQPHEGFRGQVAASAGSANAQAGASYNAQYGLRRWLLWTGGGGQRTGDYETPTGLVEDSASRISNGSLGFGWFGENVFASVGYRGNDGRYGVPFATSFEEDGDPDLDAINVAYRQHSIRLTGGLRNLGSTVEGFQFSLNYSDWNHDELEIFNTGVQAVGTTFENQQYVYRGVFEQSTRGVLSGSIGFWGMTRDYDTVGEEALAPHVAQNAFAVFALEELSFDRVQLQLGGRVERNGYEVLGGSSLPDRSFTGLSAGIGARFDLWSGGALVANYTDSLRAPALEELYNFGAHVGNVTFEIGDPDLKTERSHGLDFALRHQRNRVQGEANFFYYDIDDFVFLAPTGEVRDGLIEARYSQGDTRFLGTEVKLDVGLYSNLWLNLALDAVDTELKGSSMSLPRIPPMRGTIGLDIRHGGMSIRPEVVWADARNDVFTTETSTAGHVLVNLKATYTIPRQHVAHHLGVEFFNMGDALYRNHLSFIKDLAPEMGRGIRLSYSAKLF